MLKFVIRILLIFVLFLNLIAAQAQGLTVHGSVQSAKGKTALPGASVTLTRITFEDKAGTVTDDSGDFQFKGVTPGHYLVEIDYAGYTPVARRVTIQQNSLIFGKIELEEDIATNYEVQVVGRVSLGELKGGFSSNTYIPRTRVGRNAN